MYFSILHVNKDQQYNSTNEVNILPRLWTLKDIRAIVKNIMSSLPGSICLIYMSLDFTKFINEEDATIPVFTMQESTFKTYKNAHNFVCNFNLTQHLGNDRRVSV